MMPTGHAHTICLLTSSTVAAPVTQPISSAGEASTAPTDSSGLSSHSRISPGFTDQPAMSYRISTSWPAYGGSSWKSMAFRTSLYDQPPDRSRLSTNTCTESP